MNQQVPISNARPRAHTRQAHKNKATRRVAALAALLCLALAPAGQAESMTRTLDAEPGGRLIVDLTSGGEIHVEGWAESRVEATADMGREGSFELRESGTGIEVRSGLIGRNRPRNGIQVKVPYDFNLKLTTMSGSVTIDHVNGNIEGKTMGGPLKFSQLGGQLDFLTMGGDVTLVDSDLDGKVKTMGGKVLLENVVGNVDGSSMGGNVEYKNVTRRNGETTGDRVTIHTMGGRIGLEEAPFGAEVETMGGPIWIGSANEFVKAKTMGGAINVESLDGWAELTTMGGDIKVHMVGNPKEGKRDLELRSMGGELVVTVPDGLDMEIDIELVYTKKHEGKYNIQSDFPINTEETSKWEHDGSWGVPRKRIVGSGTIGAGTHRVKLRTINGNVILKRGQ